MGHLEERAGLAGRSAILLGGGGGLGRACALDLARAGMKLGLCDSDATRLSETVAILEGEGAAVLARAIDVREPEAVSSFFAECDAVWDGRLDALLNVVGGTFHQPFEASKPKGWDALIRTNFTWLLHATQLAIPRMRRAGGGSIVNFTSIEGYRAAPGFAVYAGMKAAVSNFGRTLAVELAQDGIRVNDIAADITPTEGSQAIRDVGDEAQGGAGASELRARVAIPMRRVGVYEDIGGCALFLVSDLSRYVTGQSLHPDGGARASSGWFDWPDTGFANVPPARALSPYLRNEETLDVSEDTPT